MKSGKEKNAKMSKRNKLLLNILLISIAVVFCLIAILVYINFYTRVRLVLTAVNRYKTGEIKSVTEYDVIDVKKGRTLPTLPAPYMEGYSFEGWYTDIDYKYPFDYNAKLNEHMQIYGKFDLVEYNIELILDGNKKIVYNTYINVDYTAPYTIEDRIYFPRHSDIVRFDDGTETSIDEYKQNHKYGYTFEGWGLSASATTTYADSIAMRAQNITFYAVWKPIQVELRYKTIDLDFTGEKISQIRPRIDTTSGGLKYVGQFETYLNIITEFNQRVDTIPAPVDNFGNFRFAGWFLDPSFAVPLKTSQLYVKNGYLTMTKDRNINILDDDLYFDTSSLTPAQRDTIKGYSSKDEKNSYITIFAKWTLEEFSIKFDLNIPQGSNYLDTSGMTAILNHSFNTIIYDDDGTTIKGNKASQGWKMFGDDSEAGVLYNENYFKDVVYRTNDLTGLPLYTILSWNTQKDGTGYNMPYGDIIYFDKDNFRIRDGQITLYAQWKSYHRINYYYLGDDSSTVLLSTINVEKNTINLPSFNELVMGVSKKGNISFTDDQIKINKITRPYNVPFNKTFIGWTNSTTFISGLTNVYIPGYTYDVGNKADDQGIYVNSAEKNLYSVWLSNDNYYTYDLGENTDVNYAGDDVTLKSSLFDESGNPMVYHFDRTYASYTLATVRNEKYQIGKTENDTDYVLWGWKLKDDTQINGQTTVRIEFSANRPEFVYNLQTYEKEVRNISTEVYISGKVLLDTDTYYTIYNSNTNRSYIYLKVPANILVFEAVWMENIVVSFKGGADDVEWQGKHSEDDLTILGAGDLYLTMPELPSSVAKRPYYEFVGWSEKNREELGINYNEFVKNNIVYNAGQKYSVFPTDKTLYAVWKPVVFTVNINQLAQSSSVNYSAGVVYIAKEKFTDGLKNATNEALFSGNIITYKLADGTEKTITLNTSAIVGYGLAGWLNSNGVELVKSGTGYVVSVLNDENRLFNKYPASSQLYINIYPKFNILKFAVTFKFDGIGINKIDNIVLDDISYGTNARSLLGRITMPTYKPGYEYDGWVVSGDKASDGTIRPEYVLDLKTSNLLVKSDMVLSLHAIIQSFSVRFIYNNPATNKTVKVSNYTIDYQDTLALIVDEVITQLNELDFVGYNFNYWTVAGGGSSQSLANLDGLMVTCPYDIYPVYSSAQITIEYNYYSENSTHLDKMEKYTLDTYVGYNHSIKTLDFPVKPLKNGYLLVGWQVGDKTYIEDQSITLSVANVGDYLVETKEGGIKKYTLSINAMWVESVKLTFDLTGVTISGAVLPDEVIAQKGDRLYLKDVGVISKLTKQQVVRDNSQGVFTGKWEDQNGTQYNAYLVSTFVLMDTDIVLKPVFEAPTYVVSYYYKMANKYNVLASANQSISSDYITPLNLHDKNILVNFLNGNPQLVGYDCVGLYLTKSGLENADSSYAVEMGSAFDFANNSVLMALAENYTFKIYMDLRKLSVVEYYSDRTESATKTTIGLLENSEYIVGTSSQTTTTPDIIPAKDGYTFIGWSTSLISNNVEFRNGDKITYTLQFVRLYPVWEVAKVNVEYYNNDGSTLYLRLSNNCFEPFNLLGDTGLEGYKLIGWATAPNSTVAEYAPNESYTPLTTDDIKLYAIWEKYYTVYYYNNLGDSVSLDEHIIIGQEFIPRTFGDTKMSAKLGSNFLGWSLDAVSPVLVDKIMINSRSGITLYLREGTVTLDSVDDYNLKLYACWETSYYSAKFVSYDDSGNETIYYGVAENPTSLSTSEMTYEYNNTDTYVFSLPTTANYYNVAGVTYKFDGTWKDKAGNIYTGVVSVVFNKNYVFTPVYKMIISIVFESGGTEIYRTDDCLSGDRFNLNNLELMDAVNTFNSSLSGRAIIGWTLDGVCYSHLQNGDHGYNYQSWQNYIVVNKSAVLEAVVVNLINVSVYKMVDYNKVTGEFAFNEADKITITGCVIGDAIDLTEYYISGELKTLGFVVSTSASYDYNPNVDTDLIVSGVTITTDMLMEDNRLYAYPVIAVKVNYAVETIDNIVKTDYVVMGTSAPNIDYVLGESYYIGNWKLNDVDYNNEPITEPVTLLALALPYYTLQMADPERRIDESLMIKKLTPSATITIPSESDAVYDRVGLTLTGWYIKSIGNEQFVMSGGSRRVFRFGETITIQDLIDLGYISNSYTYGLVPIFNYTFEKFTLANVYDAVTYIITAGDGRTYYNVNSSGNYEFYLVKNSQIIANDTQLSFVACMVADNIIVTENYNDVKAVVTISRKLTEGYESYILNAGWYYYPENVKTGTNITIGSSLTVTASMPTANDISASVGIANGLFNAVYDTKMAYFGSADSKNYEHTAMVKAGSLVSVSMTLQSGYEFSGVVLSGSMADITSTFNGTINELNGVVTVNFRLNKSDRIYLVVRPKQNIQLGFTLNTAQVDDYNADALSGTISVYYDDNFKWTLLESFDVSRIKTGVFTTTNSVKNGTKVKVVANINSVLYYVKLISLSGTSSDMAVNSNTIQDVSVDLAPMFEIVVGNRTYTIVAQDGTEISGASIIGDTISIPFPVAETKNNMVFGGYRVLNGNTIQDAQFAKFITSAVIVDSKEIVISTELVMQKNTVVVLSPVYRTMSYNVTIMGETNKSQIEGNTSKTYKVPYGSTITAKDNTLQLFEGEYSFNANGEVVNSGIKNRTIILDVLGSYQFDKWLNGESTMTTISVMGDTTIKGVVVAGTLKLGTTFNAVADSEGQLNSTAMATVRLFDGLGSDRVFTYGNINTRYEVGSAVTGATITFAVASENGFAISGIRLVYNNIDSTNFANMTEFGNACGIQITEENIENGTKYTITNAIYDVNVLIDISRITINTTIKLISSKQNSDALDLLYGKLKANDETFAKYKYNGTTEKIDFTETTIVEAEFRKTIKVAILPNSDYFEIDKIYVNGTDINSLSQVSFDIVSNTLSLYAGGTTGEMQVVSVAVKFKTMRVVFLKPDGSEFSETELSGSLINPASQFDFNSTISVTQDSFEKPDILTIDRAYKFDKWLYYNGNYELDVENGIVDFSKKSLLDTLDYTFNLANGNLCLIGSWYDLYSIGFDANGDNVSGMPSDHNNLLVYDTINLSSIPTRQGFNFAGYFYVYNGASYYLNYNTAFEKLVNENGDYVSVDTKDVNASAVAVNQLLTIAQQNDTAVSSFNITLQAMWVAKELEMALNYNPAMCEIGQEIYNGSSFADGVITFNYYDKLVVVENTDNTYIIVYDYQSNLKGRVVITPKQSDNYEFKNVQLNNAIISEATLTKPANVLDVVCWGSYVEHSLDISWDTLFSDAVKNTHYGSLGGNYGGGTSKYALKLSYSVYDLKDNSSTAESVLIANILRSDNSVYDVATEDKTLTIYDNFDIFKLAVKLRKGYGVKVEFDLSDTPYYANNLKTYAYVVEQLDESSESVAFKLNTKNVVVSSKFVDSSTTSFGNVEVIYYTPVVKSGMITGYTMQSTTVNVSTGTNKTIVVVCDSEITFNYSSNDYVLTRLGTTKVVDNSVVVVSGFDTVDETCELVFDYKYIEHNFKIANVDYAKAYFRTLDSDKLKAFFKLVNYGFNSLNSSTIRVLASDVSDVNNMSNILKTAGDTYYTVGELFGTYKYPINENYVYLYSSGNSLAQDLKNIWFEEWLLDLTFGAGSSEDSIAVSGLNSSVTISAGYASAVWLTYGVEGDETGERAGVNYQNNAGVSYSYNVVSTTNTSYEIGGNRYYGEIVLRLKDNTYLPHYELSYSTDYYVKENPTSLISGKVISINTNGESNYCTNGGLDVKLICKIAVKTLTLNVTTNVPTESGMVAGGSVNATFATTFEQILRELNISYNYYVDDIKSSKYYAIAGFYVDDEKIDTSATLEKYFDLIGEAYANGNVINVVVRFNEISKKILSVKAIKSVMGENKGEIGVNDTIYIVSNTAIAGKYDSAGNLINGSYTGTTNVVKSAFRLGGGINGMILTILDDGSCNMTISNDYLYNRFGSVSASNYNEILDGYRFVYYSTNANDNGCATSESGLYNVKYLNYDSDNTSIVGGNLTRKAVSGLNDYIDVGEDITLYAVFVPLVRVSIESNNYKSNVNDFKIQTNLVEGEQRSISGFVVDYYNRVMGTGELDISNLEADYVLINGAKYYPYNDKGEYNYITVDSDNLEIKIVWKEIE